MNARISASFVFVAALAALLLAAICGPVRFAHAQCTYPVLTDDVPQTFTTTPTAARFVQSAGRWAGAAVRSIPNSNWDVGFSVSTAAFPACLSLPVVASQQSSGVDFVIGDFAAQGTGTRYAPIARQSGSGTGSAVLEWDSGNRTAQIGTGVNFGNGGTNLIDVWNVNLVAGKSYSVFLAGNPGEFILYAFQRTGANTWRQKSDAVLVVGSQYSGPWVFTPTVTGNYPLVVVNDTNSQSFYGFYLEECVDPPVLTPTVSNYVPVQPGHFYAHYQLTPGLGFPTVAVRPTEGWITSIGVAPRSAPGAYPHCDYHPVNSTNADLPVELVVGDFASQSIPGSGALTPGNTYWIGVSAPQAIGPDAWIQYDPGTTYLSGPAQRPYIGEHEVVRAYYSNFVGGQDVILHAANCGPSVLKLWVFRWFDASEPYGSGWSSPDFHPPLVTYEINGIQDYTFIPPVDGPYAIILTKESAAGDGCAELTVSPCKPRLKLGDGESAFITTSPVLSYAGQPYGTLHASDETWSAIAVRANAANEDWKIDVIDEVAGYSGGVPAPLQCLGSTIAQTNDNGSGSRIDFLVRAGRPPVPTPWQRVVTERVFPVGNASPGGGARVEFESATSDLVIGAPPLGYFVNAAQLIGVWNLDLVIGVPYTVWFDPKQTGAELFLFRDWDPCEAAGCQALYSSLGGPGQALRTSGPTSFTPDWSGKYALIVVNQNAAQDTLAVGVYNQTVGVTPDPLEALATVAPRFESIAPNPAFGGAVRLAFALPKPARVGFEVVNLAGRIVARVEAKDYAAGTNATAWTAAGADGRALTPGVYLARMLVDGAPAGRKKLVVSAGAR